MNNINLKDYICSVPFFNLEVGTTTKHLCCASWLKQNLPNDVPLIDAWNGEIAIQIRESILDGSYRFCDKQQCPFLAQLIKFGKVGNTNTLFHKNTIPETIKDKLIQFSAGTLKPTTIQFSFDRSCNLKCPSCRTHIISANGEQIKEIKLTINEIEKEYGEYVRSLYITGSGDPFVSVAFRDFLINFDESKWPKLETIHLHTNATKWNKKMWNSMRNIHKYVKTCEISIDAACKDTYENKVRIGGNWDELIDNLKFISTLKHLKDIKTSFVIQQSNYKEMKAFYELMISIFGNRVNVFYGKINNWGTFSNNEYLNHKIWDTNHPEYDDFVKEVNSFILKDKIWHNLQEVINPIKNLI